MLKPIWFGRVALWTSACPRLGVYLVLGAMGPEVVVHVRGRLEVRGGLADRAAAPEERPGYQTSGWDDTNLMYLN